MATLFAFCVAIVPKARLLLAVAASVAPVPPLEIPKVPPRLFKLKLASTASIVGFPETPSPLETEIFVDPADIVLVAQVLDAVLAESPVVDKLSTAAKSSASAKVIEPEPPVMVIPCAGAVSEAATGSIPMVDPIKSCPLVKGPTIVTGPVPFPTRTAPSVSVDLPVPPSETGNGATEEESTMSNLPERGLNLKGITSFSYSYTSHGYPK
jgi:hypothetical protein